MATFTINLRNTLLSQGFKDKAVGYEYVAGDAKVTLSNKELEMNMFDTLEADSAAELAKKVKKAVRTAKRAKAQVNKIAAEIAAAAEMEEKIIDVDLDDIENFKI